jgi:serine/threonine protein kinase
VVGRRYRLERELSTQGGMGVVWTAIHLVTKRRVAIKLLRASGNGSDDAASRARLLREARASCAVDHPSILPVLDVIDADGAPALVMELLEGESLRERLMRAHDSSLGVRETCAILAPVAAALAAAHAARIVHRDIKPENIFLVGAIDARGAGGKAEKPGKPTVKVLDFGIAKIVATEEATTSLTESGAMLGTPYYMAPEQAFGERDVGAATDAWSLGIVLYECLAGVRPTQADNLGQVIKRITVDPMMPIEDVVADVPAELARVIHGLLVRDVAARETDLAAVAATLASLAAGTDDRDDVAASGVIASPASLAATARPSPHGRIALAALVLAAGAGALVVGLGRGRDAPRGDALETSAVVASALPSAAVVVPGSSSAVGWALAVGPVTSSAVVASETARVSNGTAPLRRAVGGDAGASANANANANANAGGDEGGTTGPGHVIIKTPF